MTSRNPCISVLFKILEMVLMIPAIFLLRFGVTNLMYVNVDMWLFSVVSSAFIILVTIILILSYCCWSHHQPTHPEFCFTMISAVGLCILGTLLLLLDHGFTSDADEHEKLMLLIVGVLCVVDSFVFFADTFYVISHPKIYWFKK